MSALMMSTAAEVYETSITCITMTQSKNPNERRGFGAESDPGTSSEQPDLSVSPSDVWEALVAIQEARIRRETDRIASEMHVGQMFRRHAHDAGTQVRGLNSDSQIFVTRIFPGASSSSSADDRSRTYVSSVPAFRRNVSVSTTGLNFSSGSGTRQRCWRASGRQSRRKKLPVRQRYASLYRRSLVGQYDRTSILRKPIYNCRVNHLKLKKLRDSFKLNTSYEMNETRRLQNESEGRGNIGEASSSGVGQTSGINSRNRSVEVLEEITSSSVNAAISSLTQNLSSLENNINSFRESISNLEGTINSTCNALRRGQSILQTINDLIGEGNVDGGSSRESTRPAESRDHNAESSDGEAAANARVENSNESVDRGAVGGVQIQSGASVPSGPPSQPEGMLSNGERTILMGVFRAGNEDGARGTSMRRHNVAAVTVSSTPQRTSQSTANEPYLESSKSRCSDSNENAKKKVQAKRVVPVNKKIYQNTKRLTHYVEEPNLGRGFIKELCISPDGRIICSPYGNGIRLLSFSPTVQDIFHCYPRSPPTPLHELTLNVAHADIVVSTKFSPYHNLLVSGCLSGKIVYYKPFL